MSIPLNILVLDDNPSDAELIIYELQKAGFDLNWKLIDNEVDYLANLTPDIDLILSDYAMPSWDGPRALKVLQKHGFDIPFIIISGTVGEDLAVECIKSGAADYILKDRMGRLGQAVSRALSDKRQRLEKHRIEHELRLLKDFNQNIVQSIAEGIVILDPGLLITFANPAAIEILGYSLEELIGLYIYDSNLFSQTDRNILTQRMTPPLEGKQRYEIEVMSKNNICRTLILNVIFQFEEGRFIGLLISFTDITERKITEETQRNSEKRFRQIFELSTLPKLLLDPQTGRIVDANAAAAQFYGYDLATLKTLTSFDLSVGGFQKTKDDMALAITSQQSSSITVHRGANGILRNVEMYSGLLDNEGKQFLNTIIIDITEKQQAIAALQEARDLLEQRVVDRTAELEKVKNRLVAIFSYSSDGILLMDIKHGIQQANYAFNTLFHVSDDSYPGMKLTALVNPENATKLEAIIQEVVATHQPLHLETQAKRADGTSFEVEISIAPVNRSAMAVTNLVCIIRNITERKQTEKALEQKRQSEHQMQMYLKSLHDITILLNRTDTLDEFYHCVVEQGLAHFDFERFGLLTYNAKTEVASGTYGTDAYGILMDKHHLQLSINNLTDIFKRTMNRNQSLVLEEEAPLLDNFKSIGMGQAVVAALWNGKFLGWLTVDRGVHNKPITQAQLDILALYALMIGSMLASKHIEIALRESEEKFKLFTESAPISTFIMNTSGIIVLVNKETENLFGYARAELVGQSIEVLVPEDDKNSDSPLLSAFITMPTEQHSTDLYQCNVRRKDGSIFSANVKFSYIFNLPTPMVMSFVIDSTQRNLVEQSLKQALAHEKELVELKTRFVSVASHEFRTPLAAILATTETLTAYRKKMDEAQIDLRLDKIRLQVMHMKHIMEDVLQLARFQAGRVEAKLTPGDLEMLCQEIIEEYQSQEEFQGRIIYERSNSPLEFAFDSNLMRQIIGNLVSNGLKYSHKEKPVRVNLIQDSEQIVIKVQDEGIGIPSDDFKNLFEPFNRASNVGAISGTGLGLSIAKQSVELQNGIIIVDSQVGKGTTFTVIFPMREGSNG